MNYRVYNLKGQLIKQSSSYSGLNIKENFAGIIENSLGVKYWYIDNKLHRREGPAIEWVDGTKEWYIFDKRHRLDGPAYESLDGTKYWFIDNKLIEGATEDSFKLLVDIMKLKGLL